MQLNFPVPKEKLVPLCKVPSGSIIRLTDSSQRAQTLVQAQVEPGSNLFMVFEGEEEKKKFALGYANLMSLDGEHICRRQNDRLVVVHQVASHEYSGCEFKAVESVRTGFVIIHGVTERVFASLKPKEQYEFLYIRTKETPAVIGRIPFVSLVGKKIFLDDDRMVCAVNDFVLNFK